MELWDVYDYNRVATGKTVVRGQHMSQDEFHIVVHVWIRNSNNELLISRRTPNKPFPNMWETVGGSAISGDDSLSAALREVKEEVGITLNPTCGKIIRHERRGHKDFPDFLDVWLFTHDIDVAQLKLQHDEVSDAKWACKEEILKMIKEKTFIDNLSYIFEYI